MSVAMRMEPASTKWEPSRVTAPSGLMGRKVTITGPHLGHAVLQRQEAAEKPRDEPTQFPAQEQPKEGQAKEDEDKEKLKKGGLKAAGELARIFWDLFSNSGEGKRILDANERDWKPILKFFEDFAGTLFGQIALGAAAGGAVAGTAAGAWSGRETSGDPEVSPSTGGPAPRAPKDEKFLALELNWDFVSPPTGMTLKTPWMDSPKIPFGSKPPAAPPVLPAPQLFKLVPKIPRICTPADPQGDNGEADARSAVIYLWLKWNQEQALRRQRELLERSTLHTPPKYAPSALKPLFKREATFEAPYDPGAVEAGLHSPGQPLDSLTRDLMESRFGYDFCQVRVHTDAQAAASARAVNALAYTVADHVVFGAGNYAPSSSAGLRLIAHELTHVVQQTASETGADPYRAASSPGASAMASLPDTRSLTMGPSDDRSERDADRVANAVVNLDAAAHHTPSVVIAQADGGVVRRQPETRSKRQEHQEARLRQLARFPRQALEQWKRLKVNERDAVLREMTIKYGEDFANSFTEYAFGVKKPDLGGSILQSTSKELMGKGYRYSGYSDVWVHPSGHEVYLLSPSTGKSKPPEPVPPDDDEKRARCADLCAAKTDDEDECNNCCDELTPGDDLCRNACRAPCAMKL